MDHTRVLTIPMKIDQELITSKLVVCFANFSRIWRIEERKLTDTKPSTTVLGKPLNLPLFSSSLHTQHGLHFLSHGLARILWDVNTEQFLR